MKENNYITTVLNHVSVNIQYHFYMTAKRSEIVLWYSLHCCHPASLYIQAKLEWIDLYEIIPQSTIPQKISGIVTWTFYSLPEICIKQNFSSAKLPIIKFEVFRTSSHFVCAWPCIRQKKSDMYCLLKYFLKDLPSVIFFRNNFQY